MIYKDDDKKRSAIDALMARHILIPAKDIEIYHGRAGDGTKFSIDPNFNNGGNATKNSNVYEKSVLYSSVGQNIAKKFAQARSRQVGGTAEIHKIDSYDSDALIIDMAKFDELMKNDLALGQSIMQTLYVPDATHYADLNFEDRDAYLQGRSIWLSYLKTLDKKNISPIFESYKFVDDKMFADFQNYIQKNNIPPSVATNAMKCVYANNGKRCLNVALTVHQMLSGYLNNDQVSNGVNTVEVLCNKVKYNIPVSTSVIASWLKDNHIIGKIGKVDSATIDETIDVVSLFDLHKVNTHSVVADKIRAVEEYYAPLNDALRNFGSGYMAKVLTSSPETVVEYISAKDPKIKEALDLSTGVWEGFSVGEHTRTVMDVYKNSYAINNDVSPNLHGLVNLALFCHDIGKGYGKDEHHKKTRKATQMICSKLGLNKKDYDLLCGLALDSQEYTTRYYVMGDESALQDLDKHSHNLLKSYLGEEPSYQAVKGLSGISREIQTCDSAAYTRFAKTKDAARGITYYNGNDLFTQGMTLQGVQIRFKRDVGDKIFGTDNDGKDMD